MKLCEMCDKHPQTETVKVQTVPGSPDTKFADMEMCHECAKDYQDFLGWAWKQKKPAMGAS
jgi:hypothetical protein